MDVQDYVRVLRAHWLGILGFLVLGLAVAGGTTALQPKEYTAQTSGIVAATEKSTDTGTSLAGNTLAQSKVKSYVDMGSWRTVALYAITTLHLKDSPEALVNRVKVTNPTDTVILQVTAKATTPKGARDLAQAWLQGIVRQVAQVEQTGGGTAAVKVIAGDSARLPSSPSSPNWKLNLLIGAVAGLLFGVVYAAVRDRSDRRIRSAVDVQRTTGHAVVGAIPVEPSMAKNPRLLSVDGSNDAGLAILAEAFRSLRTNLQYMSVDDPPRSIVVTSSAPGDGKSFTAANLAIALSATGQDVILIDGDLRRPRVAEMFGLVGDAGLSDVLAGRAAVGDVIQSVYGTSTLHVLAAGAIPPNPSEILGSAKMRDLIKTLSRRSMVIVDAPPLLAVTDAAILSTRADGTLVVARTGSTTREMLGLAVDTLATVKGKVLGVILNRVPTKGSGKVYYGYRYTGEYYRDEKGGKHPKVRSSKGSQTPLVAAGSGAPDAESDAGATVPADVPADGGRPEAEEANVVTTVLPAITDSQPARAGSSARLPRRPRRSSTD